MPLFIVGICLSHQALNIALRRKDKPRPMLAQDVRAAGLSTYTQNQRELGIPGDKPLVIRDATGQTLYEHNVYFDTWSDIAAVRPPKPAPRITTRGRPV